MASFPHRIEPSTSVSLLQLAKRGDPDGWRRVTQLYGPIVYGWARRCGCQAADAADVMQDTFAAVAGAIGRFDHERDGATFRGWLWTITRNKIRDLERDKDQVAIGGTDAQIQLQQIPRPEGNSPSIAAEREISAEPPTSADDDASVIRQRALAVIRDSFDPRAWKMFWETTVIGRPPADVAEEMSVSRWAVYKARARVLQRLQIELDGLD